MQHYMTCLLATKSIQDPVTKVWFKAENNNFPEYSANMQQPAAKFFFLATPYKSIQDSITVIWKKSEMAYRKKTFLHFYRVCYKYAALCSKTAYLFCNSSSINSASRYQNTVQFSKRTMKINLFMYIWWVCCKYTAGCNNTAYSLLANLSWSI